MKKVEKYISLGVSEKVGALLYNELFELVDNGEDSSDLQKFKLTISSNGVQLIEQTEEGNKKRLMHLFLTIEAIKERVVILRDGLDLTMMLEVEANKLIKNKRAALKWVNTEDKLNIWIIKDTIH